jgi:hypothetical protein
MEFDIGDIIRKLTGGMNPNAAIMDAQGAVPPQAPAPQAAAPTPPQPTAPQGAATPVTNPIPPAAQPKALQSPSDLANMYVTLMDRNRNAQQLDSGLNLIAAGLSNSPTNRAALISASGQGGGSGGMSLSANDMINFQKQADAQRNALIRQQALPALMKQYNMTPAQIQTLEASGKLDEVLNSLATRSLAHVTDANGQTHLVDDRVESGKPGRIIATIGSEKEDPTQWVDGPNGPELHNSRTGETIGGKGIGLKATDTKRQFDEFNASLEAKGQPKIDEMAFLKMVHPGATQINVSPSGAVFDKPAEGYAYERNPDNTVKIGDDGKPRQYKIEGGPAADAAAAAKIKTDATAEKEAAARVHDAFTSSNIGEAVKTAMEHVDTKGVVGYGSDALRGLPSALQSGLPHAKFDSALKTIGSNITIQTLAQMRAASPTGGALGSVSDFEDKMLQSVIAPLTVGGNDAASMKKNLIRIQAGMETLALHDFGGKTDPSGAAARFQEALNKRVAELSNEYKSATPTRRGVERIQ